MSHFSVMVVAAEEPTEEVLRKILAPWHEFECTGWDNEFVQDIDKTSELWDRYAIDERAMLRSPEGALFSAYDERFYRARTADEEAAAHRLDRGRKIRVVPEGYVEENVPTREVVSFRQYVEQEDCDRVVPFGSPPDTAGAHKYGYVLLTADGDVYKVIDRTNPNKEWDWWTVGGRWSGMLVPEGTERADGSSDVLKVRDIPITALREAAGAEAAKRWDRRTAIVAGRPIPNFAELRGAHGVQAARDLYWSDPVIKAFDAAGERFLEERDFAEIRGTREAAIERARQGALTPFAVVKDGQWHERGSMGWFAMVSDEKDPDVWEREFSALFDTLPPDTWVAVVDCHI